MKTRYVLILLLLAAAQVTLAQEPPVLSGEQILDRNLEAIGGREAWEQVKTFAEEAKFTGPAPWMINLSVVTPLKRGSNGTMQVMYAPPDKFRSVASVDGMGDYFFACNGKVRWWNKNDGSFKVDRSGNQDCVVASVPKAWSDDYRKIEVHGVKKVNGRPAYVVALTQRDGPPFTDYFDCETFLRVRQVRLLSTPAYRQAIIEEDYSDYREVSGVKVSFSRLRRISTSTSNDETTITVTRVVVNPHLAENTFAVPTSVRAR